MLAYDPFRITAAHLELWNHQNPTPLKTLLATQATFRPIWEKEERPYLEAAEETLRPFRTAFPDLRFTHVNIISTEGTLTIEWTVSGTHKGMFRGIAPTGKAGTERGISTIKLNEDGKVVKETVFFDMASLLTNLGVIPEPLNEMKVRELALAYVEAYNSHDIDQLKSFYTPDHVAVLENGLVLQAEEHLSRLLGGFVAFPDLKVEPMELAIRLNEVVGVIKATGTQKAPLAAVPASNQKVELEVAMVIRLQGDKIQRIHYYQDNYTALRTLKAVPEIALK